MQNKKIRWKALLILTLAVTGCSRPPVAYRMEKRCLVEKDPVIIFAEAMSNIESMSEEDLLRADWEIIHPPCVETGVFLYPISNAN